MPTPLSFFGSVCVLDSGALVKKIPSKTVDTAAFAKGGLSWAIEFESTNKNDVNVAVLSRLIVWSLVCY